MNSQDQPDPQAFGLLLKQLDQAERGLLRVHKALLDYERGRYEHERGPIRGSGEFLQLLIHDPWFAWLRPISQLAARIDEFVSSKKPTVLLQGEDLLARARALLIPSEGGDDFQRQYHLSIQQSAEVAKAHADWQQLVAREGLQ